VVLLGKEVGLRLMLKLRLKVAEQVLRPIPHPVLGQANILLVSPDLPNGQKQVMDRIFHPVLVPPRSIPLQELLHERVSKGVEIIRRVSLSSCMTLLSRFSVPLSL
jgi:hypothetical protein